MPLHRTSSAELYYEVSGASDGPCIVLSSSLGTDMSMWKHQIPALEQHFRVLRYDMRGHGRSSAPIGPYTIAQLGRDVLDLLSQITPDPVVFCGLSIGGVIGQWIGVHAPERLKKLILCNTAAKIGIPETWNDRIQAVRTGGMACIAPSVVARWFTQQFQSKHQDEVAAMLGILTATEPEGYTGCCAAIRDMDHRELVRLITAPTLIVAGEFDPVTTIADAQALHQSIKRSSLVTVPASHISAVEAPAEFDSAILHYLQEPSQ